MGCGEGVLGAVDCVYGVKGVGCGEVVLGAVEGVG